MESRVKVELIGVISLTLESGYELVLENALFVLSMRRNLISVSILDKAGYIHDAKWSHFMEKCETNSCGNFGTSTMQAEFVAFYEAKK